MYKIVYPSVLASTKQVRKMAESKILMVILNWLIPPVYIFAFITNIDTIKGNILFLVALVFMLLRIYYWVIRAKQNTRLKDIEIREKEYELRVKEKIL